MLFSFIALRFGAHSNPLHHNQGRAQGLMYVTVISPWIPNQTYVNSWKTNNVSCEGLNAVIRWTCHPCLHERSSSRISNETWARPRWKGTGAVKLHNRCEFKRNHHSVLYCSVLFQILKKLHAELVSCWQHSVPISPTSPRLLPAYLFSEPFSSSVLSLNQVLGSTWQSPTSSN